MKLRTIVVLILVALLFCASNTSSNENNVLSPDTVYSLQECISIILDKSDDLAIANADIDEKKEGFASAKKDLYPALSTSYRYSKQKPSNTVNENTYSYNFSVEQPVYRGGALQTAVNIGKLSVEASNKSYLVNKNNLIFSITNAYYDLLRDQRIEKEADFAVKRLESHLKNAESFYKVGMIPKNDLLLSEVELAQGIQDQLVAQNAASLSKTMLNLMMKRPVENELLIEDVEKYTGPKQIDWKDELSKALELRPELAKQKIDSESAKEGIKLSQSSYLPEVTLTATYMKTGDDPLADFYPLGPSESQSAVASASWDFWSWGQNDNEKAVAKKKLLKSKKAEQKLIDQITFETRQAYLIIVHTSKNIIVAQKAVSQAEENYRINEARYKAQLATSTDVLDAQNILTRANTNYYKSLYAYKIALASLDRATGSKVSQSEE